MKNMTMNEFAKTVAGDIAKHLPLNYADCSISVNEVVKNNDTRLFGITVGSPDSALTPVIYLEQYHRDYLSGRDMGSILDEIASVRMEYETPQIGDPNELVRKDAVRGKITARILNARENGAYLSDKPFRRIEDLAVVYYVTLGKKDKCSMGYYITGAVLENLDMTEEELYVAAMENMKRNPPEFMTMSSVFEEVTVKANVFLPAVPDVLMYVLSNAEKNYGASAILDENTMRDIGRQIGPFYILPSSVHEVIIVPERFGADPRFLKDMVKEVNMMAVLPNERLSDNVYYSDGMTGRFRII